MNTLTPQQQEKQRQALSNAAVARISRAWPDHTAIQDLKRVFPAISAQLEAAEKRLNDTWLSGQLDMASMDEFERALRAWEDINYKAAAALKAVQR